MESRPILSSQTTFTSRDTSPILSDDTSSCKKVCFFAQIEDLLQLVKKRYVLSFYAFFGFFVAYSLRANLSVAIVDMSQIVSIKYDLVNITNTKVYYKYDMICVSVNFHETGVGKILSPCFAKCKNCFFFAMMN